jgi:hypothetical protein
MKMTILALGEAWMSADEAELNRQFVRGVGKLLEERGVVENPLLVLRVSDIVVSWLLARRMEAGLEGGPEGEAARTTSAQAEAIGKSRERLRKAIKELEEYCERAGTPIDRGLADLMKPVIQQIQGTSPFFAETG